MKTPGLLFLILSAFVSNAIIAIQSVTAQTITTVAGTGIGNDSLSTKAELFVPMKVAFDGAGNTYIADAGYNMIRKVDASGIITTYAGTGNFGTIGDGGPATAATFENIYSVGADRAGNVYIVDAEANRIRKVSASGIISTIAGTGAAGYNGDGITAVSARLNGPSDIAIDTAGNIYVADRFNYRVRKIGLTGFITTVAGNGTAVAPVFGGPATASSVGYPFRIALDNKGNLFIASYADWHVMEVSSNDTLTNIAGAGTYGYSGDGGLATAATFSAPCGVAVDTSGNVYFSDIDYNRIRMVNATTGIITTMAGNGVAGYGGDSGPATVAQISAPEGLNVDANNNLYIADMSNNRVRIVNANGVISTFAGQNGLFGEGYPATNSELSNPQDVATDGAGNIYVADMYNHRVRMINATTGIMTTVAGGGISGYADGFSGDGGPATLAALYYPSAVAVDAAGNLYICDQDNQRVRKVNTSGIISTIAGNGTAGFLGNGSPAVGAELHYPTGVAVDASGNVYICDNNNQRVRKVSTTGTITTIAGTGTVGYLGDGGPAIDAELSYPVGVAVDAAGNVYIGDQGNSAIRMVDTSGTITTIAGNGGSGYSGDGGPAAWAELSFPQAVKVDNAGNIYIADDGNNAVRVINSAGNISTLAGVGGAGFSGDGGPAIAAQLNSPTSAVADHSGNVFIGDGGNHRIRKVNISYLGVATTQQTQQNVLVYPNPTKGIINIVNAANSIVIINDVAGNEIMKTAIANATQSLDISALASGVYLVQVISQNGQSKIVKVTKE